LAWLRLRSHRLASYPFLVIKEESLPEWVSLIAKPRAGQQAGLSREASKLGSVGMLLPDPGTWFCWHNYRSVCLYEYVHLVLAVILDHTAGRIFATSISSGYIIYIVRNFPSHRLAGKIVASISRPQSVVHCKSVLIDWYLGWVLKESVHCSLWFWMIFCWNFCRLMGKVASDKCHKWVFKEPTECEPNISNYWQSSFDAVRNRSTHTKTCLIYFLSPQFYFFFSPKENTRQL